VWLRELSFGVMLFTTRGSYSVRALKAAFEVEASRSEV